MVSMRVFGVYQIQHTPDDAAAMRADQGGGVRKPESFRSVLRVVAYLTLADGELRQIPDWVDARYPTLIKRALMTRHKALPISQEGDAFRLDLWSIGHCDMAELIDICRKSDSIEEIKQAIGLLEQGLLRSFLLERPALERNRWNDLIVEWAGRRMRELVESARRNFTNQAYLDAAQTLAELLNVESDTTQESQLELICRLSINCSSLGMPKAATVMETSGLTGYESSKRQVEGYRRTPVRGREELIGSLRVRLSSDPNSIITLKGITGVGKTRVATELAYNDSLPNWAPFSERFGDNIHLIRLNDVTAPIHMLERIGQELGLLDVPEGSWEDRIADALNDSASLLILDNFDGLTTAVLGCRDGEDILRNLTFRLPGLSVFLTSCVHVEIGTEYELGCLLYPGMDESESAMQLARSIPGDQALKFAAVQMFVDRRQKRNGLYLLTEHEVPFVIELCQLFDGIPLSLRLVAASRDSTDEMLSRARKSLLGQELYIREDRDTFIRSMRTAYAMAYEHLTAEEQSTLLGFCSFASTWTLKAAVQRFGKSESATAYHLERFDRLGLVTRTLSPPRYRMHGSAREHLEQVVGLSSEQRKQSRSEHFWCYHALAKDMASHPFGLDTLESVQFFSVEQDNFRSALRWSLTMAVSAGAELVTFLMRYWELSNGWSEGLQFVKRFIQRCDVHRSDLLARLHYAAGILERTRANYPSADEHFRRAADLFKEQGDIRNEARAANSAGYSAYFREMHEHARQLYDRARRISTEHGFLAEQAYAEMGFGLLSITTGELSDAYVLLDHAESILEPSDSPRSFAYIERHRAEAYRIQGNHKEAIRSILRAVELRASIFDERGIADCLGVAGLVLANMSDYKGSYAVLSLALRSLNRLGVPLFPRRQRELKDALHEVAKYAVSSESLIESEEYSMERALAYLTRVLSGFD